MSYVQTKVDWSRFPVPFFQRVAVPSCVLLLGGFLLPGLAQCQWSALASGTDGEVFSSVVLNQASGPALYAGGQFANAGGAPASNIAKWDGAQWSPLGSGTDDLVWSLAVFNDGAGPALYAGGHFINAGGVTVNGIARWDGRQWSALGNGTSGEVHTLAVFNDGTGMALYAGGIFSTAGDQTVNNIAKWNGSAWSPVGGGLPAQTINSLTVFNDGTGNALYAGSLCCDGFDGLVNKWNGSAWSALGDPGFIVNALSVFNDGTGPALYAAGRIAPGGPGHNRDIFKWDGTEWVGPVAGGLGTSSNGEVRTLSVLKGAGAPALVAGGAFAAAGASVAAGNVASLSCMQ